MPTKTNKYENIYPKSSKITSKHKLLSCERNLKEAIASKKFFEHGGEKGCVVREPIGYGGTGHRACSMNNPFEVYCTKKTEKNYRVLDFTASTQKGKPVHKYFTTRAEAKNFAENISAWKGFPVIPVTKRK